MPEQKPNTKESAGELAKSVSTIATRMRPCGSIGPATRPPSRGRLHGTRNRGRDSNPLFPGAKYPKSSPPAFAASQLRLASQPNRVTAIYEQSTRLRSFGWQASLTASRRSENYPGEQSRRIPPSREVRLQRSIRSSSPPGIRRRKSRQNFITNMVAALWIMARRRSEPFGSPRHRWTESLRSRRSLRRAPRFACMTQAGVRVPRSGKSRTAIGASGAGGSENKKPSGAAAREGLSNDRCRFALCETASMSCACAIDWPIAIRQLRKAFHCLLHRSTHVLSRDTMSARGRLVLLRKYQVKPVAHNRSFANGRSGRFLADPTPSDGSDFALSPAVEVTFIVPKVRRNVLFGLSRGLGFSNLCPACETPA